MTLPQKSKRLATSIYDKMRDCDTILTMLIIIIKVVTAISERKI